MDDFIAQTTQHGHGLGWHPAPPSIKNYLVAAPNEESAAALPPTIDMRPGMPPIGNQGNLGSCTAWASTAAYRYELGKQKLADFEPSELAQYYWSRQLEGTTSSDSGATIKDAVKVLATIGAAPGDLWQYYVAKFASRPPSSVKAAAKKHLTLQYLSVVQDLNTIKAVLAAQTPVIIGISVYSSFEGDQAAKTGVIPMPTKKDKELGGHALLLVGYDDSKKLFTTRNSWGTGFGDKGYIYLPYDYVTNKSLGDDYWALQTVE